MVMPSWVQFSCRGDGLVVAVKRSASAFRTIAAVRLSRSVPRAGMRGEPQQGASEADLGNLRPATLVLT